jgi:adenosine deaminase
MPESNPKSSAASGASATLFVSLGTSPAIVPEAFLMPQVDFEAVRVLTTARPDITLIKDFFTEQYPEVKLTICRVEGFNDFESEQDHFRFEEILYRWILQADAPIDQRWFCLSGGFKTMSASVQKAASLYGAAGVFHVLTIQDLYPDEEEPRNPSSIPEILNAQEKGKIHWIQLGAQSGWPQMRHLRATEFPLNQREGNGVTWLYAPGNALRRHIMELENRTHAISESWDKLAQLPFNELATWPEQDLVWLNDPVNPSSALDRHWIHELPKLELHCHLGGFATHGPLLSEVESGSRNPQLLQGREAEPKPDDWPLPDTPFGLEKYRKLGDNNGSRLLKDPGCLNKQCKLLYDHFLKQNIKYAEVRCSPANYSDVVQDRSPWSVLSEIRNTFQQCMQESAAKSLKCHVNLIIIGTRQTTGNYRAGISRHLALAVSAAEHWRKSSECRVVGVDLAGFEDPSTRAHYFREEFTAVHRCGLALTVHAGENDDAEAIWRAVFGLNARRLGHALSLTESPDLMKSVADRGIGIEMCPYANFQIVGFDTDDKAKDKDKPKIYPLLDYLRQGLKVTVNTDNIGISSADLSDNLLLAARMCPGLTRMDLLRLQRHALDTCFEHALEKQQLIERFECSILRPSR